MHVNASLLSLFGKPHYPKDFVFLKRTFGKSKPVLYTEPASGSIAGQSHTFSSSVCAEREAYKKYGYI